MRRCRPSAIVFLLGLLSCPATPGGPVASPGAEEVEASAYVPGPNPFVLTGLVSSEVVFEVDWIEGRPPAPKALRGLEAALRRHCEPGRRIEVRRDESIPREEWERATGREGLERLVARHLDGDPGDWTRSELIYVLYAPDGLAWFGKQATGLTDLVTFERSDEVRSVRTIFLFTEEIRRESLLWITEAKIQRATLVHELGHVLGLVANPDHAQRDDPTHCSRARCVMHQPRGRARMVNAAPAMFAGKIPSRLGPKCRRDLEDARRRWNALADESTEFAGQLAARRRVRLAAIAEAWRRRHENRVTKP